MRARDLPGALEVLLSSRADVASVVSAALWRDVLQRALHQPDLIGIVACEDEQIAAINITALNPEPYWVWRRFLLRHPMLLVYALCKRLQAKLLGWQHKPHQKEDPDGLELPAVDAPPSPPRGKSWAASLFVAVHPDYRGRGIARSLLLETNRILTNRGISLLLRWTGPGNIPMQRAAAAAGAKLFRCRGRVLIVQHLNPAGKEAGSSPLTPSDR